MIASDHVVGPGAHSLEFAYAPDGDGGGTAVLGVDGREVGRGVIPRFTPTSFSGTGAGLSCGYEVGPRSATTTRRRSGSQACCTA